MERNVVFLVFLVLFIVFVDCFGDELEAKKTDPNTGIDSKNSPPSIGSSIVKPSESKSVLDSAKVDQEKKGEDHDGGSQGGTKNDSTKSNLIKDMGSKEYPKVGTNKDDLSKGSQVKKGGGKKEGSTEGLKSKKAPKEGTKEGDLVLSKSPRKDSARGEECDPSNKCMDEKNTLTACLRVPGKDSPDLSLLIQNKGTNHLTVKIYAPDFVHLDEAVIQLQEKEGKEVTVTIGHGDKDTLIVLTAGSGNCSIDFRDLIPHDSEKKSDYSAKFAYTNILTQVSSITYVSLAAVLLIVSAWMCVRFRRKHVAGDGSKYQKLETELPVSGGGKTESDVTDGWDNSWGDNWDDEEAPKTPTMPITPSMSSKGLASRRFSKDGWKD